MTSVLASRLRGFGHALRNLGVRQTVCYAHQRLRHHSAPPGTKFVVASKYLRYPLLCRAGTSDVDVFRQILIEREYRCLDEVDDACLVIDCGANVGFSSAYFLSRYPRASLIAVEPDPGNFELLEENLRPYGHRVRAILSAVWSHGVGLVICDSGFGDGREWARTVRPARPGEMPTVTAFDLGGLLEESGHHRISILKIDIEGAESAVFASNYEPWIDKVDNLVIELHGDECERIFSAAIARYPYEIQRCDELTVCRRAQLR